MQQLTLFFCIILKQFKDSKITMIVTCHFQGTLRNANFSYLLQHLEKLNKKGVGM